MKAIQFQLVTAIIVLLSGCSKDDDNTSTTTPSPNQNNSGITINSSWQYSIKVDGIPYARVEGSQDFVGDAVIERLFSILSKSQPSQTTITGGMKP